MEKIKELIKENQGTVLALILSVLTAVYAYGHKEANGEDALAAVSTRLDGHEQRLGVIETDNKQYGKDIAKMSGRIDDLWHDAGHRDK